jgi:predicted nucleic acid-binding protein
LSFLLDTSVASQPAKAVPDAAAKMSGHTAETGDVLIAATAIVHGLTLATLNRKHFERLGVDLVTF